MERNLPDASVRGGRFSDRPKTLIRDWSFPLVLMLAWSLAVTYTLVIASRPLSPIEDRPVVAPSLQRMPVVHAPASLQQPRRPS